MSCLVIANPHAGKGRGAHALSRVEAALRKRGVPPGARDVHPVTAVRSALSWVAAAAVFSFMSAVLLVLAGAASPCSYDGVLKLLCRLLVACFGVRVESSGLEKLDREKSYLFVANHVNILDGFILYGWLPWLFRGVELEEHFSWPVYGWFIRTFGNIPVSPGSGARTAAGLRRAVKALSAGISILVLPEGHRTLTGELGSFGRGAFRIAERMGAEIAPLVMAGAFRVMRRGRWTVRPGTVRLRAGEPIDPSHLPRGNASALRDLTRERMVGMLQEAGDRKERPLR
jgi:1-acyl-sn-glycerol-3-phosphate acyltransferase